MNWEKLWGVTCGGSSAAELPPDGEHTCVIASAREEQLPFKRCPENELGDSIVMTLQCPGYEPIEEMLPGHFRGKVEALCAAAGIPSPRSTPDWDVSMLLGKTLTVRTCIRTAKATGREYCAIEHYLPGPASLQRIEQGKPAAARTPAAKAHRSFADQSDDVPF